MRKIIFSLLLTFSLSVQSQTVDLPKEVEITTIQVNQLFESKAKIDVSKIQDLVDKEEKVGICIVEYKEKQGKSYAKITQQTLYDLIHNFGNIVSKMYGKKSGKDNISYEEKIEALAKVQCEAYYAMGVLK